MTEPSFKIGDRVRPKPEWADHAARVPAGRIVRIADFGIDGGIVVDAEPGLAFSAHAFELDTEPEHP